MCLVGKSDNFVIGLTNVSPTVTPPTLFNYALCGQYPGHVEEKATVHLQCACGLPPYRYVIMQFPIVFYASPCELEVYIRRKFLYIHRLITCQLPDRNFKEHRISNSISPIFCFVQKKKF